MTGLRKLGAIHLIGNALALWLGYYWLGIGESRTTLLVWSLAVGLTGGAFFCWLHGAGFAFFRESGKDNGGELSAAMRHLPALLAAAAAACLLYALIGKLAEASPSFSIASFLTLKLRKPVKPNTVLGVFTALWWIVRWIVIPALLMPMISAVAGSGWRGFKSIGPIRGYRWFWLEMPLLLLCALWAPLKLLGWHPVTSGFGLEMFSFIVRAGLAYLFFVAGCLGVEFSAAGGSMRRRRAKVIAL